MTARCAGDDAMSYPQPINFSDIAVGMLIRQTNTWTDGSTLTLVSYVTGKSSTAVRIGRRRRLKTVYRRFGFVEDYS